MKKLKFAALAVAILLLLPHMVAVTHAAKLSGTVKNGDGTPLCALVLANGQYQFTCGGDGAFDLPNVPYDAQGKITLFAFCNGLPPYQTVLTEDVSDFKIKMIGSADTSPPVVTIDTFTESTSKPGWIDLSGTIENQIGTPLCAMVLANGGYQFTCDPVGEFKLTVPPDKKGNITLYGFCSGLPPYKKVIPITVTDVRQVPLWDGETGPDPDGPLVNRYGGPVVHQGGTRVNVSHTTNVIHAGRGAYQADIVGPVSDSDLAFFQLALSGFHDDYVMARDITPFKSIGFWLKNDTGVAFTLKLEIKDYRDSNSNCRYRRFDILANNTWQPYSAPLDSTAGWTVSGAPDLTRAKSISFVFEALNGHPLNQSVYFDDVILTENGTPMDPMTTDLPTLVENLAKRQFMGLWGSRNRDNGLISLNSVFANVAAMNSTAAIVKLLPTACQEGWVSKSAADDYISILVETIHSLMDKAYYLPARYVDWKTLAASYKKEESPVDAAFLALALFQYRAIATTPDSLRAKIDALLARFQFAPFATPQGWKLAYELPDTVSGTGKFTPGTYDGYSGEIWTISLAAHLINSIDILQYYHTGVKRVPDETPICHSSIVHEGLAYRAPFLQWIFPLFVDLDGYAKDNFPAPQLATNPLENAIAYQRNVHCALEASHRGAFLQPDAGDNGSGQSGSYAQYSIYFDNGKPNLFMPWSVAFSLLTPDDAEIALEALRNHLANGLHGPLGLSDSAYWTTTEEAPSTITARHDFWNVALSTMAMFSYLYHDNALLTDIPEVQAALGKVFPPTP